MVAVIAAAGACTSGDSDVATTAPADAAATTTTTPHEPTGDATLDQIGFATASTAPLERIELTGVASDDDADGLELWLRTPEGDVGVPVFASDTSARFAAPLHPGDPRGGGTAELYFRRGAAVGPLLELEIEDLPRSPGAWDEFVEEFVAAIDRDATALGSSFDELRATAIDDIDDVDPTLLPLKVAQGYVDDGSENDLESLPDHDELTELDRELLDDLAAQLDLGLLVRPPDEPTGFRRPAEPSTRSSTPPRPATRRAFASAALESGGAAGGAVRHPAQSGGCISAGIEVADAADLASKLTTAADNAISEGGAEEQVLDGIGSVTTAGGFIPGVGWGVAGVGAGFLALEAYLNGTAGLYPSSLSDLESSITDPVFPEDFQADGFWETVTVTARSTGWQADADIAAMLLAAASAATAGAAGLDVANGFVLDLSLYLRDNAANAAVEANAEANGGVLNFCPEEWTVDITGEPWSTGYAVLERFEVDPGDQSYAPIETGLNLPVDDTLRVETNRDEFAGQHAFEDHPIEVLPILVGAPEEVEVDEPGDTVDIEATIANAVDPELDWNGGEGGWQGDPQLLEAGSPTGAPARWRHTHVAAPSEDAFPYVAYVESTASTGLRADGDPPRTATFEVHLKQLIVTPEDEKVLTRQTLQFTARDRDGNEVDVSWSATGGGIGGNGLYTAGEDPGVYTVTATSQEDPELTDTVQVEVVEADCVIGEWQLREQDFLDQLAAFMPQAASLTNQGGRYLITFADDGAYTGRRDQWAIGISTPQGTIVTTIDSVESGTWTVDQSSETLFVSEETSNANIDMTLNGLPLPGGDQQVSGTAISGQGAYTCEGDLLEITITEPEGTIVATLDRIA